MSNKSKTDELTFLPNIGKVVAKQLKDIGINTASELKSVGSENAFLRLQAIDEGACINLLMGLEGAIQGIRWDNLDESCKTNLRVFHKQSQMNIKKK